jgi:branched-chain amino acid transport system ATP-binding protein
VLEIIDVAVSYGKIRAVQGVTLGVRAGEVVALLGNNGAGKSTLLRTVAGVLHPDAGRIVFEGRDVTRLASHRIARLGLRLVPEGRGLLSRMTVWENLLMGQYTRGRVDTAVMDAALRRFPVLRDRRNQIASTLSGGEQQMLAIARAVVGGPRLLMLDEPSLGLAPLMVDAIFEVVRRLKQDGATILLVEQNARKALQVADRAYILETGKIVLEGPAPELAAGADVQRAYLGGMPHSPLGAL